MGKYAQLRDKTSDGLSKDILGETSKEHTETMEHPFMKSIYQVRVDLVAYVHYLRCNLAIFDAIETAMAAEVKTNEALKKLDNTMFMRSDKIASDIENLLELDSELKQKVQPFSSSTTANYLEKLSQDVKRGDTVSLGVHHMLQYLAVLSGGQYIKQQIVKALSRKSKDDSKFDDCVQFYAFEGLKAVDHPKTVQSYMDKFDAVFGDKERELAVSTAKKVYAHMLEMFDECYEMNPVELQVESNIESGSEGSKELTHDELKEYTGENGTKILISIRRKIYDVSSGSQHYGPDGSYGFFAGHDVTKILAKMILTRDALDDLSYTTDGDAKAEKILSDWEAKLGAKYPIYGKLVGDGGKVGSSGVEDSNQVKSTTGSSGTCPFSGKAATEGESCPFASSQKDKSNNEETKGECPWPFIWLHDPAKGMSQKHMTKNIAAVIGIVAIAYSTYFLN